jgi:hypothetical protein
MPAWSLLGRSSADTSMIKQKHCRFLYRDLLQSELLSAGQSSAFNTAHCLEGRWVFNLESIYGALITFAISIYIIHFGSVNSTKHFSIPNLAYCSKSGRGVSSVPKLQRVKNSAWCQLQTWIQTKPPDWSFYRDVQVQPGKLVWIPLVTSHDVFWNIRNRIFAHGSHKQHLANKSPLMSQSPINGPYC